MISSMFEHALSFLKKKTVSAQRLPIYPAGILLIKS